MSEGGQIRAIYSYGIDNEDMFGQEKAQIYNAELHEYDCYKDVINGMEYRKYLPINITFHDECAAGGDFILQGLRKFTGLATQLRRNGHDRLPDSSILGKMDIEGGEWQFFAEASVSDLKKFYQWVIELHYPSIGIILDEFRVNIRKRALEKLYAAGFVIVYSHVNMHCRGDPCIEMTLARVDNTAVFRRQNCKFPVNTMHDINNPYGPLDHPFFEINITKHFESSRAFRNHYPYPYEHWFQENRDMAVPHENRLAESFHLEWNQRVQFRIRQARLVAEMRHFEEVYETQRMIGMLWSRPGVTLE